MKKLGMEVVSPKKKLCTDNAAMIGICSYYKAKRKDFSKSIEKVDRLPNLQINGKIDF